MMEYKGYVGVATFDDEAELFHGEVLGTRDVITFQGQCVQELKLAFRDSVDDYLAFCVERGKSPGKPYSGRFNLRLSPDLHARATAYARSEGLSLNRFIERELERSVG